jgi:transposase
VIGECHSRHRHQECRKFLRRLDAEFPPELKLHVVMDNYGTHKEPHVQAWLKKHPRFVCHFVPTSSSWLNLVERWFRELTEKAIRRGSFVSVPDLKQAIEALCKPETKTPSRSSGAPPSMTSSKRSIARGSRWSRSLPDRRPLHN